MDKKYLLREECDKIFDFWKLQEYFTPRTYPELTKTVKEYGKEVPFDYYYNDYTEHKDNRNSANQYKENSLFDNYVSHNKYLIENKISSGNYCKWVNIYYGCYKLRRFVMKMVEICELDIEKYPDIHELDGRFYTVSIQTDLDGKIKEKGVRMNPFFYAAIF